MGGVKAMFSTASVAKDLKLFLGKSEAKVVQAFQVIGENIVNDAKSRPQSETYTDRTTNLRNSIGNAVKKNNKTVSQSSNRLMTTRLIAELPKKVDIQLNVVAGMDYAACVEALEGYSVLTGSIPTKKEIEVTLKEILGE